MTMATTEYAERSFDVRRLAARFAPQRIRFDPWGLVSGYKAYLIYASLAARSDAELGRMGLTRAALPAVAMRAATVSKAT